MACGKTFTPGGRNKKRKHFKLFKRWVTTGAIVLDLVAFAKRGNKASRNTLLRSFHQFLDKPPLVMPLKHPKEVYLKIDGTYFKRWGCALVYKAGQKIIFWNFVKRENYSAYLFDLVQIVGLRYKILGITSDKHGSLKAVIKTLFLKENEEENIPHQHCLVHLQRKCQSLLTQNPQTKAGIQLLELVKFINKINNHCQANIWLKWLERLTERHESLIKERTYGISQKTGKLTWWYTHKNLRRAFKTLEVSKDNLFLYLDYPKLPKDINGLEAEFSHLKRKLSLHRGLKRERKINFIKWYFHFKANTKK